ncbi:MAG: sigma-70 family RNA polymerase sigma factor [Acidobacteria bacterium]|nr:sigma-70 family RNA polymerase sigma factor [Acidobacteriota bacterium]
MLVEFELVRRAQAGDGTAFQKLVTAYHQRTLGTIARLIGRPEDVEDVGQEVFLRLYFSLDRLRSAEVFETWLYRLTVNAAYDYLRKRSRRGEFRIADLSEEQVRAADWAAGARMAQEEKDRKRIRDTVNRVLDAVSPKERILLLLKEVEGLSLRELAKIYGVKENALKVRLFRARQRILNSMSADKTDGKDENPR